MRDLEKRHFRVGKHRTPDLGRLTSGQPKLFDEEPNDTF
jgi:hypothetical protein